MSGTNPGTWPDQEPNEPQMSRYTAADLAKAREDGRREGANGVFIAMRKLLDVAIDAPLDAKEAGE